MGLGSDTGQSGQCIRSSPYICLLFFPRTGLLVASLFMVFKSLGKIVKTTILPMFPFNNYFILGRMK